MCKVEKLEPREVFRYFSEISSIPRGSGNLKRIEDYLEKFADKHSLKRCKDDYGNVVIYGNATKGYEKSKPVLIQGHMDMVCEKTAKSQKNMTTDGLDLKTDGEFLWAEGTSLGGDDGIAVAYALALLSDKNIPHPTLEILLTADEEIGLLGADNFDSSIVSGKRLINIDSEKEGILTVSCAGGVRACCTMPLCFQKTDDTMTGYLITIDGFKGGHSGVDINKHRKNAVKVLGRMLEYVSARNEILISTILGGTKENVIPKQSQAIICVKTEFAFHLEKSVELFSEILKKECLSTEPDVMVHIEKCETPQNCTTKEDTKKLIFTLLQIPDGIQSMSPDIADMVQTSLNLGVAEISDNSLQLRFLLRSNASTGKQLLVSKLQFFIDYLGGTVEFRADYPVWEYRTESPLRDIMVKAYEEIYADKPQVCAIHAGLECGILGGKIPDADMVSFGPDIENVHTPEERMNVGSVERCWNYLKRVLEKCK